MGPADDLLGELEGEIHCMGRGTKSRIAYCVLRVACYVSIVVGRSSVACPEWQRRVARRGRQLPASVAALDRDRLACDLKRPWRAKLEPIERIARPQHTPRLR